MFSKKNCLRAGLAAMMLTGAGLWMPSDFPWSPNIVSAAQQTQIAHIGDIQGGGHISPYNGKTVKDVRGVITFRQSESVFFIQDDGDVPVGVGDADVYCVVLDVGFAVVVMRQVDLLFEH